jgi:hypothetical protein
MAIKHKLEIIEDVFVDTYLKINDYQINSQIEKQNDEDEGIKTYIICMNIVFQDMKKTKNIKSENEIMKIENIDTFTLEKAYNMLNQKYKGDRI